MNELEVRLPGALSNTCPKDICVKMTKIFVTQDYCSHPFEIKVYNHANYQNFYNLNYGRLPIYHIRFCFRNFGLQV